MQTSILTFLIAAVVVLLLGPIIIPTLKRLKFGQTEREDGPQTHLIKSGTPTIGGIMMIAAIIIATLAGIYLPELIGLKDGITGDKVGFLTPAILVMCAYGLVGFIDDFIKVKTKSSLGLRAYQKIIAQFAFALVYALYLKNTLGTSIYLPFFNVEWDISWLYVPFAMFVIIAVVNCVNLTDGLDGLASGVTLIYSITMCVVFLYLSKAAAVEGYKLIEGTGSLAIYAAALGGACLGFLRFNSYPAKVFMGDTGSMALGGAISVLALTSRAVFLLPIMGICFVASGVSVILQVGSYKLRNKKRIFKMAPLHHHFEKLGYCESKIVSGYMIVTTFACLICLLAFI
ncbi:MAG TPA: phospho-N-acetylmuramoyl-pentapeptide-transferase [Clostridiales bacterium]|jgi:phospho-N-acetylmuramoyl-pentapeptide-transferase|nr:phospho-N-acetylmuramoyl-pentapeptide-transferase [Clostridiales bacterium]